MPPPVVIPQDSLQQLAKLANELVGAEAAVEAAEQALKDAKERARQLREEELPDFMQELGISDLKLEGGEKISYKDDVRLEWDAPKKERAFAWLEEHDFGGLIKTEVGASFGKGEIEKAKALLQSLSEQGFETQMKRDVNWQTMCAFLREQIAAGNPIPLEEWGAVAVKKATVKLPKGKAQVGDA